MKAVPHRVVAAAHQNRSSAAALRHAFNRLTTRKGLSMVSAQSAYETIGAQFYSRY